MLCYFEQQLQAIKVCECLLEEKAHYCRIFKGYWYSRKVVNTAPDYGQWLAEIKFYTARVNNLPQFPRSSQSTLTSNSLTDPGVLLLELYWCQCNFFLQQILLMYSYSIYGYQCWLGQFRFTGHFLGWMGHHPPSTYHQKSTVDISEMCSEPDSQF